MSFASNFCARLACLSGSVGGATIVDDDEWRRRIGERFADWGGDTWRTSWQSKPPPVRLGEQLHGVVIAVAPFGAWVDAGIGTPVLLHLSHAPGFGRGAAIYPAAGSDVTCWVFAVGAEGQVGATIAFVPEFLL